jgi:fatty acid desaturase
MSTIENASPLPSSEAYFRELTRSPGIAWPTMGLFFLSMVVLIGSSALAINGTIPLWLAALPNGLAMYNLFSVAHDAAHRSLSSNKRLNEWVGRLAIMIFMPIAPFEGVRWIHMQHHRFTNGATDPDRFVHHARWWQIPIVWSFVDVYYLVYFVKHGGEQLQKHLKSVIIAAIAMLGVVGGLIYMGYGMEILFLWFLASRIALFLIATVFVFLPHYPGDIDAQEDKYKATTVRRGLEGVLNLLMVNQNYHLIHHLYPTVPFYRYQKVWHLKYGELVAHDPAVQTAFGLKPINV